MKRSIYEHSHDYWDIYMYDQCFKIASNNDTESYYEFLKQIYLCSPNSNEDSHKEA